MPDTSTPHKSPLAALLGANIRRIRSAAGLTIDETASAAGISPVMLRKIETAHRWPSPDTLDRIATALDVPPAEFLAETHG